MEEDHQLAAVPLAVIGAPLGIIVGYFADATTAGPSGFVDFGWWFQRYLTDQVALWGCLGAAVGFGLVYVRQLLSN